ncbi:hypothetical protein Desca_2165 [Desulfotomaculum nigrificans CO-1-SRB]|uniref:Uncharacterized protein n=1 Tax=Desulfotomaculum nigrificans (strain DSM 14880 / VKM B-2319 / CO-1-SRB) TaxID=868595 RepID=F6BA35_DESCC|nr:hypothetical protein [Desulfotomaculum nigrificans]AEF95004.1 hypothetical protein Desca_2165 [Desulfotomaculum nigrificans CO-1-SRB]
MNERVKTYYKNNFLYAGHRMVLPDTGEKFRNSCHNCKYYVNVIGQHETRKICLAGVKVYKSGAKRVPQSIEILELILLLGKQALYNMLEGNKEHQMACGSFEPVL